jgi:hypothetical protein
MLVDEGLSTMARSDLAKTYLYSHSEWIDIDEDPLMEDPRAAGHHLWSAKWYEALGYDPRPHFFGIRHVVGVEVHKQDDDSDDAPYTYLCLVSVAGVMHTVYAQDTPSLIGLLREMGPAMQAWNMSTDE